ncbi:hypothetical protein JCM3770_007233 [Rhodotorula araucariae]
MSAPPSPSPSHSPSTHTHTPADAAADAKTRTEQGFTVRPALASHAAPTQPRADRYSPRLATTSRPAPPLLADPAARAPESDLTQPLIPARTPPRSPLRTASTLSLPSTPLSAERHRPPRRAPSIASRRSSVSSSLTSTPGFRPAAAPTLAPLLDTRIALELDVPHIPATLSPSPSAERQAGVGASIGLGRPSGPASRLTAASPPAGSVAALEPSAAEVPPAAEATAARRSFSLPFGRRAASQPVAQAVRSAAVGGEEGTRVPVVERLRSFSRR